MSPDRPGIAQQIAHFEARLREDPGSRAFLPLADLYRRSGELAHARDLLRRGLDRHPAFVTARVALGLVLNEMGEGEGAREVLDGVLAADGDNLLALEILTAQAAESADWTRACSLAERWLRLAPENGAARDAVREARRQLEIPAAAAATAGSGEEPGGDREAMQEAGDGFESPTLAELYLRQGHPEKARLIIERILAANPQREDAREILARIEAHEATPAARPPEPPREASGREAATPPAQGRAETNQDLARFRAWLDAVSGSESSASN